MIEITKGVYCKGGEIDRIRVKQVNGDGLATSVYIFLENGEYVYMFFQNVNEARDFAVNLMAKNMLEV